MKLGPCGAATVILVVGGASLARAQRVDPARSLPAFRSDEEVVQAIDPVAQEYRRRREAAVRAAKLAADSADRATTPCAASVTVARGVVAGSGAVIRGYVRDEGGVPLDQATVRVLPLRVSALTDSAGMYRIVIPAERLTTPQSYDVTVNRLGVVPYRYAAGFIQPGDSVDIGFHVCEPRIRLNELLAGGIADGIDEIHPRVVHLRDEGAEEGDVVKVRGDVLIILRLVGCSQLA